MWTARALSGCLHAHSRHAHNLNGYLYGKQASNSVTYNPNINLDDTYGASTQRPIPCDACACVPRRRTSTCHMTRPSRRFAKGVRTQLLSCPIGERRQAGRRCVTLLIEYKLRGDASPWLFSFLGRVSDLAVPRARSHRGLLNSFNCLTDRKSVV